MASRGGDGTGQSHLPPVQPQSGSRIGLGLTVRALADPQHLLHRIRRRKSPVKATDLSPPAVQPMTKAERLKPVHQYHLGTGLAAAIQAQSKIPVYQFTSPLPRDFYHPDGSTLSKPRQQQHLFHRSPGMEGDGLLLNEQRVADYLRANTTFLEDYVLDNVDSETLERWLIRRSQRERNRIKENSDGGGGDSREGRASKFCVHADKRQMLQTLMNSLATQPQPNRILWELACCVASAVGADGFILHLVQPYDGRLMVFRSCDNGMDIDSAAFTEDYSDAQISPSTPEADPNGQGHSLASYVAKHRHPITVNWQLKETDQRFPAGSLCFQEGGVYALGAPVIQNDGTLAGVIELYRRAASETKKVSERGPFHEEDEEIVSSYLLWGGIALHYADMYHKLAEKREQHKFLLTVVRSIFQDIISIDKLIRKVMNFAQKLVDADRASLFLVDHKAGELYSRIFDMGEGVGEGDEETSQEAHEIRFPIGTGIAGYVALTGEVLNIADAYADERFNRAVDQQTGYQTRSILCMPIFSHSQVIGVVQMINKRHGEFSARDEEEFELFAVYCGLALHHNKLYDRIRVSEQKYRVSLEVLSYHNCCSEEEFAALFQRNEEALRAAPDAPAGPPVGLDQFWFSAFSIDDMEKVNSAVYMFVDLFGLARFERDSLIRFMLTVRKNYRRVPYHNWTHGFAVANSMYAILKRAPEAFEALEAVALFVGSLCHDLDHRGKNNKFMLDTASPLATIYTTSTMEHHHFNQTVTILQQEGHNILSKLSGDEYKEVLRNIKHCILATDLAIFFPNRAKLSKVLETGQFSWKNKEHRLLLQAIAMTGSDLCASSKPWDVQAETVKVIFEEFYEQGDAEKAAGRVPISMMDRDKLHLQPDSQVGFISDICIPCYGLLYKLIPETKPLLDGCQSNLERWRELAQENEQIASGQRSHKVTVTNGDDSVKVNPIEPRSMNRSISLPHSIDLDVIK